jgi:hypothetical protein
MIRRNGRGQDSAWRFYTSGEINEEEFETKKNDLS